VAEAAGVAEVADRRTSRRSAGKQNALYFTPWPTHDALAVHKAALEQGIVSPLHALVAITRAAVKARRVGDRRVPLRHPASPRSRRRPGLLSDTADAACSRSTRRRFTSSPLRHERRELAACVWSILRDPGYVMRFVVWFCWLVELLGQSVTHTCTVKHMQAVAVPGSSCSPDGEARMDTAPRKIQKSTSLNFARDGPILLYADVRGNYCGFGRG
jgi:hypothetical protein